MNPANLSYACCMYPHTLFSFLMQDSWAAAEDADETGGELHSVVMLQIVSQNCRYGPCCCHWQPRTSTARQSAWASRSQYEGIPRSPAHDISPTRNTLISYY
ncbi:hypothetical protein M9H77_35300 [Catharanthus roseus]|uniref:Uncharacterized protein n=1 Tax=Catharanthus roseus TaxID=4058 RepID=A0ACB9ZNW6_CATRO|nr:hypothetical protein M9H77_35300 [Catharanthus roseus]